MPTDEDQELTTVVTPRLLRRVAGERFFVRGEAYFAEGAVRSLRLDGGGAKALVQGNRPCSPFREADKGVRGEFVLTRGLVKLT